MAPPSLYQDLDMDEKNKSTLSEMALDALEAADLALAHVDNLDVGAPHTAADVSAEWLNELMAAGSEQVKIEGAEIVDGHDGMTDRRRWRLKWNDAGISQKRPEYVFAKATPHTPYLRETLSMLHMAENEVRFYNQLQPEIPHLAPAAYHAAYYAGGRFLLIMQDLEAAGFTPYWAHHECSVQHAGAVVDTLADLHATYWNSERFAGDLGWVRPRLQKFGRKWHRRSFVEARRKYPETELGSNLPQSIRDLLNSWNENAEAVYRYWATLTPTVLHGDSHLGNTYSAPDGTAGFFDWQVIFRGHGLRDLAYFLNAALSNDIRQAHSRALFERYIEGLGLRGIEIGMDKAWKDYGLFILDQWDAHMKAYVFGGYGHMPEARNRSSLTLIGALQDHDVAGLITQISKTGTLS